MSFSLNFTLPSNTHILLSYRHPLQLSRVPKPQTVVPLLDWQPESHPCWPQPCWWLCCLP
ncbi:transmembrane protein 10, isoform CRA_a [Mus musculus]|nr:transmembrane protein 10, isoform CRA_a [Mus musculus]